MAEVRFSQAEIDAFLHDPAGPVAHLMEELGGRVAVAARAKVRKRVTGSPGKSGRPGTSAAPLATLDSIESELEAPGDRLPWARISAEGAALFLEKGTRRHFIESHGDWSLSDYGRGYFGRVVDYPGNRPYPFLTTGLWALQDNI